ncbi:hypothetical protein [Paracoccus sp. (in: a-proteobacteria)]|uniref:hypothetical protein n=1 Tax=Paracoccus sp. TaxID=267 RepID=UPI00396CCB71
MYPHSRIGKAHFLVYSNGVQPFAGNADHYCRSALKVGFDTATHYTEDMLRQTPFWEENRSILEQPRGAGYWLWKPYVILDKLKQVGPDDIVIYNDAGRYATGSFAPFPAFPQAAAELTALSPKRFILGTRIPWLIQGQYTKRDCLILTGADSREMRLAPQINACPALFMPSPASFDFLQTWLDYARDPRILTDQPDELGEPYPEFEDHRHDMAIASILLHKTKGHYFDLSEDGALAEAEELRRRNRHVPRLQTHVGYLSLIASRALKDDFFADETPDLAPMGRLIRNLTPDEPIPEQKEVLSPDVLLDEFVAMAAGNAESITFDHLRAAASRNRITAMKLHGLAKVQADEAALMAHALETALHEMQALGLPVTEKSVVDLSVRAVHLAIAAQPETEKRMAAELAWASLDDEGRALFKAQFNRPTTERGQKALQDFAGFLLDRNILSLNVELAGRSKMLRSAISKHLTVWMHPADAGGDLS